MISHRAPNEIEVNVSSQQVEYLGADLSTTALSVGLRGVDGREDFVTVSMRGETKWYGQPGFHLKELPAMFESALDKFQDRGWSFSTPGRLSLSVRQHDLVLMDQDLRPLIPALSWECHVAEDEVRQLCQLGVDQVVGPIAPRFILPKLMWALRQDDTLAEQIDQVATTGDYITAQLTGQLRLSCSDALSNALLDQNTKQLARTAIDKTPLSVDWFPKVISSGQTVGEIQPTQQQNHAWDSLRQWLAGWSVAAGLGDNHAGAVGSGLTDAETIVISGGSSGTVVRACRPTAPLLGEANCFEFYDDRLLLLMLADCANWYNRFLQQRLKEEPDHDELNRTALAADIPLIQRVKQTFRDGSWHEVYPASFDQLNWPQQVASTQASISLELILLVKQMLAEVRGKEVEISRIVLTGGLCQSEFIRSVLFVGLKMLLPNVTVRVSARNDRLAFQSATYGAVINAMLCGEYARLRDTIDRLCPQRNCKPLPPAQTTALCQFLREHL